MRERRPYMDEAWFAMLEAAAAAHPRRRAGVADELGISRSAISQVLSGTYGADPARIGRRVLDHYDRPQCPLVGRIIDRSLCRKTALRDKPRGGEALARWTVCQSCANKPKE